MSSAKIDLGLGRVIALLEALGNPQDKLDVIHVAGTNGKGSTCAVISSILWTNNIKCGRFTSPHLITPRDCIVINNTMISESDYQSFRDRVDHTDKECGSNATGFEKQVAMMLLYFAESGVEVAVIEVGLGGRLDATNVFKYPAVCVFTAIGMDHVEFLGDTIEKIATEKAGIMKAKAAVVIGPQDYEGAEKVFLSTAARLDCHVVPVSPLTKVSADGFFCYKDVTFQMPFLGGYQLRNVATALTAIETLTIARPKYSFSSDQLRQGVEAAKWPGRLDWTTLKSGLKIMVDGAHNPAGAKQLRSFLDGYILPGTHICWIMGVKADKDSAGILTELVREGDSVIAVPFSTPEGMPWVVSLHPAQLEVKVKEAQPTCKTQHFARLVDALDYIS
ncbi:hypothetical protein HDU76_001398, partial [Blyttiomyces sp. JEL0837]